MLASVPSDVSAVSLQRLEDIVDHFGILEKHSTTTWAHLENLTDNMEILNIVVRNAQREAQQEKIYEWLSPPDPFSNHNTARQRHEPLMGHWFINGKEFEEWRSRPNSIIWLHGIRKLGLNLDHGLCRYYLIWLDAVRPLLRTYLKTNWIYNC